jgi:hypothetical protein
MEYYELGELQKELDLGKQYEEPVFYFIFILFLLYFIFIICFPLGVKEMVGSHWPWSSEASLS